MNRPPRKGSARASVLDRLLDGAPGVDHPEWGEGREASVEARKRAIQRDLEWLLNTRRTASPAPAIHEALQDSVHHYGLPDLTSRSADDPEARLELVQDVESTIRRFEPRLTQVRVVTVPSGGAPGTKDSRIRFRIEALLRLDPAPVRVQFDTRYEVANSHFHVDVPEEGDD